MTSSKDACNTVILSAIVWETSCTGRTDSVTPATAVVLSLMLNVWGEKKLAKN